MSSKYSKSGQSNNSNSENNSPPSGQAGKSGRPIVPATSPYAYPVGDKRVFYAGSDLNEIDTQLYAWTKTIASAYDDLMRLYDIEAFEILSETNPTGIPKKYKAMTSSSQSTGETGSTSKEEVKPKVLTVKPYQLAGQTYDMVYPALQDVTNLFIAVKKAESAIDIAKGFRNTIRFPFFVSSLKLADIRHKIAEAEKALSEYRNQENIATAESSIMQPMSNEVRKARVQIEKKYTAWEFEQFIHGEVNNAVDIFVHIDECWLKLVEQIDRLIAEMYAIEELAKQVGVSQLAELSSLKESVAFYKRLVDNDPLRIEYSLTDQVKPIIDTVRGRIEVLAKDRNLVQTNLSAARATILEISMMRVDADAKRNDCRKRLGISPYVQTIVDESAIIDLKSWLEQLEAKLQLGEWQQARVGISRLQQRADELRTAVRAEFDVYDGPIQKWKNAKRTYIAISQQSQNMVSKGLVLDRMVTELSDELGLMLRKDPLDLENFLAKMAIFEKEFRAQVNKFRNQRPTQ